MKSVAVHATLMVAALLTAFVTWTRGEDPARDDASVLIWEKNPAEVAAVVFQARDRSLELQRRGSGNTAHVWTIETLPEPPAPTPVPTASAGRDSAKVPPPPPAPRRLHTDEYPAGKRSDAI